MTEFRCRYIPVERYCETCLTIFTECHTSRRPSGQGRQKRSPRKCWRGKYLQDRSNPPTCALCPLPLQWCEYVSVDTLHCTCSPAKALPLPLPVFCLLYILYQYPFFILKCNLLYKGFFKLNCMMGTSIGQTSICTNHLHKLLLFFSLLMTQLATLSLGITAPVIINFKEIGMQEKRLNIFENFYLLSNLKHLYMKTTCIFYFLDQKILQTMVL